MSISVTNVLDELEAMGEAALREDLSSFSCDVNVEIEEFIKEKAIDFAKRKLSITYIVSDTDDGAILGYFTLTHKSILLNNEGLSKTVQRKLERYSRMDRNTGNYMASAFLLAQFGKNYGVGNGNRISGKELMKLVNDILSDIQRRIGGGIVYLDCEDKPELVSFYTNENFKRFDDRFSEDDKRNYIQFMRFL